MSGCAWGPWPRVGLTTRFRDHVGRTPLTFWETKDVLGVRRPLAPGAVACVSLFADNRLGRDHPDWRQVAQDQSPAARGAAPYFDWDCLCPSREGVRRAAMAWVDEAVGAGVANGPGPASLRLSDVGFAREGYCRCVACAEGAASLGLDIEAYRERRILSVLTDIRARVTGRLFVTLYPDPYPGHLERRFGVSPDALATLADAYVVPLYDLAYATTHWLETLCQGFADRLRGRAWYAELYALGVPEERLRRAARVALAYANGVVLAYERDAARLERLLAALAGA